MTFSTPKTHLKALRYGKKLNHSLYIIEENPGKVDRQLCKFVRDLKIKIDAGSEYNVVKFFTKIHEQLGLN